MTNISRRDALAGISLATLAACGGGSGSGTGTAPTPTPTPERFRNARRSIVGSAQTADTSEHAFHSAFGRMQDLGTLGGRNSTATATSDGGYYAGFAQRADRNSHAFLCCDAAGLIDLGTLGGSESWAYGINDWGAFDPASPSTPAAPRRDRGRTAGCRRSWRT